MDHPLDVAALRAVVRAVAVHYAAAADNLEIVGLPTVSLTVGHCRALHQLLGDICPTPPAPLGTAPATPAPPATPETGQRYVYPTTPLALASSR